MATMANELTPKQESFCQRYIETGNASEAYRLSYQAGGMKPESVNRSAKEMLDNPKITSRLSQLRELHQKRHNVTIDSLTAELDELRRLASEAQQFSPAVTAVMGKAKLHGIGSENVRLSGELELNAKVTIYMPDNGRDANSGE